MRKAWRAAAAVLMCVPLIAAAEQGEPQLDKQAYLVIDEALEELQGQVYGSAYGVQLMPAAQAGAGGTGGQTTTTVYVPYYVHVPTASTGISLGAAAGVGFVGGMAVGAFADAAAQSSRNREIESLREILDDGVLRRAVLGAVSNHFDAAGHTLAKRIIFRNPDHRIIRRAIGRERPDEVIIFDSQDIPLVMLSRDNRRVMVQAQIAFYLHEDGRDYDLESDHKVAFISQPSPEGVDPLEYWSEDEGGRVLEAVDLGIRHLVAVATAGEAAEPVELDKNEGVELMLDGQNVVIQGRHLAQHGDYAYLQTAGDWVRVWPATPVVAAVTDAGSSPVPAAAPAAPQ